MDTQNQLQLAEISKLIERLEQELEMREHERELLDEFEDSDHYFEVSKKIDALQEQRRQLGVTWRKLSEP